MASFFMKIKMFPLIVVCVLSFLAQVESRSYE